MPGKGHEARRGEANTCKMQMGTCRLSVVANLHQGTVDEHGNSLMVIRSTVCAQEPYGPGADCWGGLAGKEHVTDSVVLLRWKDPLEENTLIRKTNQSLGLSGIRQFKLPV
jgi:hypothetical protein